ncbi:MAG TPA: transglutaminase-like domain-containing protein [Bacteroidales bacterium]|nr:transglutaminase-like domain-containing protein [Bacteroidales bacterium]
MMADKEIKVLINLLEDPDQEVFRVVSEKLQERGIEAVPSLEKAWESSLNQELQEKIEELIHNIQFRYICDELRTWTATGGIDLLYGAFLIAKYQYPDIYFSEIEEHIEVLRKEAWLEIHNNLTALEKVRILNHVIFGVHKFSRNSANFYSPRNSFINQVFETRKGNPISLAIIYSVVAEKLEIPVYGVNLPLNYILAYQDRSYDEDPYHILFYINPFNRGTVLSRKDIDRFLYQQKLEPRPEYFTPCRNVTTIERVLRNLIFAYEKMGYSDKTEQIKQLLNIIKTASDRI